MNNVVDRVPTEVLANGAVRWEMYDSSGVSQGYVYLKKADEPSVAGTPLNKVLFDSIEADLTNLGTNKLNVASKASTAEAEAGTDNTKYTTPKTVLDSIKANAIPSSTMSIKTGTVNDNGTIPQTSGFSHYMYFASVNSIPNTQINVGGNVANLRVVCEVNQETRRVLVGSYGNYSGGSWKNYTSGVANYLELAWN